MKVYTMIKLLLGGLKLPLNLFIPAVLEEVQKLYQTQGEGQGAIFLIIIGP